jgi:quercetin 2,3-dioxygenase
MTIEIRSSAERGKANFAWLDSHHTFSFGQYYDPQHMGFASLRVINEDRVIPGEGFATHSHRDMEIITYVLSGAIEHRDSLGNGSIIYPGDVQRMSAGTGIQHSEYNPSATEGVHFLQIWIVPAATGIAPSYEQKTFSTDRQPGNLLLVGSRDGRAGSVSIYQDVDLYAGNLDQNTSLTHVLNPGRVVWLQVTKGTLKVNDRLLQAGDGAAITAEPSIVLVGLADDTEVLLFDLADV